jgi:hypothetical protein
MQYSLSYRLGAFAPSLDPDAKAYIDAVVAAGATVSGGQKRAINNFIVEEKAASRWTLHKRFYLPIWAVAAANAIDMVSRTSGTFVGEVTHSAGYVAGDGSTGYFEFNGSATSLGLTQTSQSLQFGIILNSVALGLLGYVGNRNSPTQSLLLWHTNETALRFDANEAAGGSATITKLATLGIFSADKEGGEERTRRRNLAGATSLRSATVGVTGTLPTFNIRAMIGPLDAGLNNGHFITYGASMGLTSVQRDAHTLAVKTLWETCTGLTLP